MGIRFNWANNAFNPEGKDCSPRALIPFAEALIAESETQLPVLALALAKTRKLLVEANLQLQLEEGNPADPSDIEHLIREDEVDGLASLLAALQGELSDAEEQRISGETLRAMLHSRGPRNGL